MIFAEHVFGVRNPVEDILREYEMSSIVLEWVDDNTEVRYANRPKSD